MMPLYEFVCQKCGEETETYLPLSSYAPPECCNHTMERKYSVPALSIWNASRPFPNLDAGGDGSRTFSSKVAYESFLTEHHLAEVSQGGDRVKRPHGNRVVRTWPKTG